MSTNKSNSILDYTVGPTCIAHSNKLGDLKKYRNYKIYYITNK